jgi:uncharacterized protein
MQDFSTSLSEEELNWLDRFLLERINDDADTEGRDEGILDISELDGFLTAIVSGPDTIPPSKWLPAVWADFEPEWKDEKEAEGFFALLFRHMNDIATILLDHAQDYEPIFLERKVKEKTYTIVEEWCHGYMRGVALTADQWTTGGREMQILLTPIMAFAVEEGSQAMDTLTDTEIENIQRSITPNVREIYAYWLARRQHADPSHTPVRRTTQRVGRNDPCPCGSGKKYKKCCLH